jgi:hypothetical protein
MNVFFAEQGAAPKGGLARQLNSELHRPALGELDR